MQQQEQNRTLRPTLARRQGGVFLFALGIMRGPMRFLRDRLARHFHKRYRSYRHAKLLFTIDLVLVGAILILAGLAGWTLYERFGRAAPLMIQASTNPAAITSGAPVTFTFEYKNRTKDPLENVILAVRLPPHFELQRSFPKSFSTQEGTLPLGTVLPGVEGVAKITGLLWGEVESTAPVLVTTVFTRPGTPNRLVAFRKFEFPIKNSVLETSLLIPDQVLSGQPTPFTFSYHNDGETELRDVIVKPILPERATILADRTLQEDGWHLGTLLPDERGTLTGTFELTSPPSEKTEITFQAFIIRNEDALMQSTTTIPIVTLPTPVTVTVSTPLAAAKPGTELSFEIRVENTGNTLIRDVTVTVANTSPAIDPAMVRNLSLGDLAPYSSKTGTYLLPLRSRISSTDLEDGTDHNLVVVVRPEVRGVLESDTPTPLIVRGNEIRLPLETPFALQAFAHYYSPQGDQIGRGPLPPQVGKTTKYWITWELAPTTNELEGVLLQAKLPPWVAWTGEAHATVGHAPQWDASTRTVRWSMDRLPPTITNGHTVTVRFEIALTPTESLRGTTPTLVEEARGQAFDTFTETTLTAAAPTLTTTLPHDDYIRNRIRVR